MPSEPPSSDASKVCEERARLMRQYSEAASTYAECVRELSELVSSGREQEIGTVRVKCRAALEEAEKSRLALYRHEADHHCDRGAGVPSACDH
jgi:hypothetical protein